MSDLLIRVTNSGDHENCDDPLIILVSPSPSGGLQLTTTPVAEFLWGDRYAGWLRDMTGIGNWALDAGFEPTTLHLTSGVSIHTYSQSSPWGDSYVIGVEDSDDDITWLATHDQSLASRLVATFAAKYATPISPAPVIPMLAGWSFVAVSTPSLS